MTGVEILTTEEVATEFASNKGVSVFVFIAIVIICATFGYFMMDDCNKSVGIAIGCSLGVFLGLIGMIIALTATEEIVDYETQYKVTISDEVQLNEFNEKYEIIEQDGKIYTVRERK